MRPRHPIIPNQVVPVASIPRPIIPHERRLLDLTLQTHPNDNPTDLLVDVDAVVEHKILDVNEWDIVDGDTDMLAFHGLGVPFGYAALN